VVYRVKYTIYKNCFYSVLAYMLLYVKKAHITYCYKLYSPPSLFYVLLLNCDVYIASYNMLNIVWNWNLHVQQRVKRNGMISFKVENILLYMI